MARTQTMVQLHTELVDQLDREAQRRRISRSALIRGLLSEALDASAASAIDEAIVAGYEAHPPAEPDAWGDRDALAEAGTVELLQRLDEEESSAW